MLEREVEFCTQMQLLKVINELYEIYITSK